VREPGRTAGPSAALGNDKGEGGDFYEGWSDRMDRKKKQVSRSLPVLNLESSSQANFHILVYLGQEIGQA